MVASRIDSRGRLGKELEVDGSVGFSVASCLCGQGLNHWDSDHRVFLNYRIHEYY